MEIKCHRLTVQMHAVKVAGLDSSTWQAAARKNQERKFLLRSSFAITVQYFVHDMRDLRP